MEQYTCTCHCGGAVFYRHFHAVSCPLSQHGDKAPLTEAEKRASELQQQLAQAEARVQALEQENARLKGL